MVELHGEHLMGPLIYLSRKAEGTNLQFPNTHWSDLHASSVFLPLKFAFGSQQGGITG